MSYITATCHIRRVGTWLAIAAAAALGACSTQPGLSAPTGTHATQHAYELHGNVNQQLTQELARAIEDGHRDFAISSNGGNMYLAQLMSMMINKSDSNLTAESNCYSACAYMLLAAKNRHVAEDADVRIHSSFTPDGPTDFGYRWLQSIGRSDLAEHWGRSMNLHRLTAEEIM